MKIQSSGRKFFVCFAHPYNYRDFASFAVKKGINLCLLLSIFLGSVPKIVWGQSDKLSERITSIAENLANNEEDPEEVSAFIERLQELSENPVKINSSNESEISRLFFLSDFQVKALADYTHTSGRIVSLFELAVIPGFDIETVEMITPFITLENKFINNSDSVRWRNSLISNFSVKSNTMDNSYLGSPWKILTKYNFKSGGFSGGMTAEKDPGEKALSGNPPLPDFLSAYLDYSGSGIIRKIIVGDFSAGFGLGTNINNGVRRGISLSSPGYMSANDEIKPYTSAEENKFFRGAAAEFSIKNLELSIFISKNYTDATLASSSGISDDYVENFYSGGVHNTSSLLSKKDAVSESVFGATISYNMKSLKVGLSMSENKLSLPILLSVNDPEKIFNFTGNMNNIYSVYYNSMIKNILLFGEFSVDNNKKYAIIQGASFRPSDRLTINFLLRDYEPGYTAFYGNGPGTSSKASNEKGIVGNFSFEAAKHLFISGGCDIMSFPWLKYRCSAPSFGVRKELKIRYLPIEKITFDASYSYRLSMADSTEMQGVPYQNNIITRGLKASLHYSLYNNLIIGTRVDFKSVSPYGSKGFLLFQEFNYSFRKIPVTIWARYCLFNTDDWSSRIYTYENDLLYSYSIPVLAWEGSRSYIMAKWKISDRTEMRIKYGMNSLIKPGNDPVNTDEIKLQMRVWF